MTGIASLWRELERRQRALAVAGAVFLLAALPMAVGWGLDERTLRGANVWIKPIKFALSTGLYLWTLAWFVGHLRPERRRSRGVAAMVVLAIATAAFEVGWIAWQAALGEASHYNRSTPFHAAMYTAMGIGAVLLASCQAQLAWMLGRHADPGRAPAYRLAVRLGLWLGFWLGAGIGGLLAGLKPPAGAALPFFGWALAGGDLRPAHFVGLHAAQALPLFGWWWAGRGGAPAQRASWPVVGAALLWCGLFAGLVAWGLQGRA
jgi:hypothetical protein